MTMKRPTSFAEFHGQAKAVEQLKVAIKSAKIRKVPLGHCLLYGPAGLGKTSLAQYIIPNELGVACTALNCAAVERAEDILPTLSTIKAGSILFLDEIHMLPVHVREHLLTVLEDSSLTVNVGTPDSKKLLSISLPKYTIVGATTRLGLLPETLQDRFKLKLQLETYSAEEMAEVLKWLAAHVELRLEAAEQLVAASHGTARIAVTLVEACLDTVVADDLPPVVTDDVVKRTLARLGYIHGLTATEAKLIKALVEAPNCTLGVKALASVMDDDALTLETVVEPWLMQTGLITRTQSGRQLTEQGKAWYAKSRPDV